MSDGAKTARRLWTTAELADFLGVPVATVYGWRARGIRGGGPPAFRVGGVLRFDPEEVHRWLEAGRDARA